VWGTISIASTAPESAGPAILERLARFADLVQLAVGNAEAWETLTQQATTDAVTGLPNRQWFNQSLATEIARAERHSRPLSLVLFDLDNFKQVNDTFGHPTGDRVLHELGERLTAVARRSETVARIGGEEFAWILPETNAADAFTAAEHARTTIASEAFKAVGQLTVSAGVSSLTESDTSELLIARADTALYDAKRGGRNRTATFETPRP
jgi:diguanylate cyclase (GGDEF)-like protein